MSSTIEERVKKICIEHLGANAEQVTLDARFAEDLGADSLDEVELVMAFEEEFEIEILDDEGAKIKTVAEAVNFITDRIG